MKIQHQEHFKNLLTIFKIIRKMMWRKNFDLIIQTMNEKVWIQLKNEYKPHGNIWK